MPHKICIQTNRYALFTHQFVLLYIPVHQITTVPSSLPPLPPLPAQCDADQEVTRAAVKEDKYENILTLIGYYDIESRIPIRLLMLQVFGVLCGMDREIISIFLSSILPNELGRDINNRLTGTYVCTYSCNSTFPSLFSFHLTRL